VWNGIRKGEARNSEGKGIGRGMSGVEARNFASLALGLSCSCLPHFDFGMLVCDQIFSTRNSVTDSRIPLSETFRPIRCPCLLPLHLYKSNCRPN